MPEVTPVGVATAVGRSLGFETLQSLYDRYAAELKERPEAKDIGDFASWRKRFARRIDTPVLTALPALTELASHFGNVAESRLRLSCLRYGMETGTLPPLLTCLLPDGEVYSYDWLLSPDDHLVLGHEEHSSVRLRERLEETLASAEFTRRCRDWLARSIDRRFNLVASGCTILDSLIGREPWLSRRLVPFSYFLCTALVSYGLYAEAHARAAKALMFAGELDEAEYAITRSNLLRISAVASGFMYFQNPERALPDFWLAESSLASIVGSADAEAVRRVHRHKWLREVLRYAARQATRSRVLHRVKPRGQRLFFPSANGVVMRYREFKPSERSPAPTPAEVEYRVLDLVNEYLTSMHGHPGAWLDDHPDLRPAPIDWDTLARVRLALLPADLQGLRLAHQDFREVIDRQTELVESNTVERLREPGGSRFELISAQFTEIILKLTVYHADNGTEDLCHTILHKSRAQVWDEVNGLFPRLVGEIGEKNVNHFREVIQVIGSWLAQGRMHE